MLQKANLLILDEPTNHLDLDSKEVLENALIDYPGTILFVSHDRYFINRIATKVYELSANGVYEYLGDYDYYQSKKAEQHELAALDAVPDLKPKENQNKLSYEQDKEAKKLARQKQRRLQEVEERISFVEQQIEKNEELLCDPEIYQNHTKVQEINTENDGYQQELEHLMNEWEELQED